MDTGVHARMLPVVGGKRHDLPIARNVVLVVIRARGEEICRLAIPVVELPGDTPYVPPGTTER